MNRKWFTLVEILVWISISMILMVSVWVLISWWIKNITNQEKTIENTWNFSNFENKLNNYFQNIDTNFIPITTSSWIILKVNKNYDEWGFIYIWETKTPLDNWNWIYCYSWSENPETNHVFIKNFIPDFDIDIQKSHTINWVWKWFFWFNKITETWVEQDEVYLNTPTGSVSWWWIIFISDTLNNRVLYKSWSRVYELLNEKDWLKEPTWLYYDLWDLYIANSWNKEILKYSSKNITPIPSLTLTWITENNVENFEI